ncbi:hypothetical protein OHA91_32100 [Streptomyces erythrochromogenes]|uniref:Uncharacterized protein n=1 Tax=Streptomyces erythrochromogenes TaxID=285574 RepID=A0ABZ1QJ90_9ACTN|nr:hypothetical protein [Streptomyces erythrochromogenes]MCX5588289.1 hypothetical protein [Streptomyces erythrochromogenes]
MNSVPPTPDPLPLPAPDLQVPDLPTPDPRSWGTAADFAAMRALVAGLVVPGNASMYVMSALETSRELIRYSYYRYEFATVAVAHSLFALEHVLAERLGSDAPLGELIRKAAEEGLVTAGLAAELDHGRLLRDGLTRGARSSAALTAPMAVARVRAVFDAVSLLLGPPPTEEAERGDRLARLWEEHRRALFPDGFRGVSIEGVELILLDADTAILVEMELTEGMDSNRIAGLWACIAALDKAVPRIDEEYCAAYFARLRTLAGLAAARHIPAAT